MKKVILALLLCLALPCSALAAPSVPTLNLAGLTDMLAKNKGKVIMLNFFATWCPPCRVEIPELVSVRKKYAEKDVLIVSLSLDEDAKVVPPFVEKMKMTYPVFMADRDIAKAFKITQIPHNAFYSRDGQLILSEPGMADAEMVEMVFKKFWIRNNGKYPGGAQSPHGRCKVHAWAFAAMRPKRAFIAPRTYPSVWACAQFYGC